MKKQFNFSIYELLKTILGINLVILIVIFLLLIRSKWFNIQIAPFIFIIINSVFLYKIFSKPQILSIEIEGDDVSIKYLTPFFRSHYSNYKIADFTVERFSEVGFRGIKREVFMLKMKNLQNFKIYINEMGWKTEDLNSLEDLLKNNLLHSY